MRDLQVKEITHANSASFRERGDKEEGTGSALSYVEDFPHKTFAGLNRT
jgi:hypothetical protein